VYRYVTEPVNKLDPAQITWFSNGTLISLRAVTLLKQTFNYLPLFGLVDKLFSQLDDAFLFIYS
jgi:hypothetical protein